MKLLQKFSNLFTVKRGFLPTSSECQAWLRGDDLEERSSRLMTPYQQSAWVYIAVSVLAESLAHVPFRISRGKGKGEVLIDSGPVYELFQHPHPSMNRVLFWQTLVSWEALRGEFFVAPLDSKGQPVMLGGRGAVRPAQMLPLDPDYFVHIVEDNQIVGWAYKCARNTSALAAQVLLPEEVIHSRNFNPYLFWRGLSPLSVAMLAASSDYAAEQFMKGLMLNNGDAGLIVTTEEMLDETQREQLVAALNARKRRAGTADRPLFLWGKATIEKPTLSSADSQFLENRKLNRQEIGAIFKVPESMMGFAGQKNALSAGTAIEQDRLNFIENTISGICRRLETAMEPLIKSFDPALNGWFDLDALPIMQAARRDRMETAQKAFAMGVPFNDINQVYDLGFESLPWGDTGYLPGTLREVGVKVDSPDSISAELDPFERLTRLLENSEQAVIIDSKSNVPDKALIRKLSRYLFEQRGRVLSAVERNWETGHEIQLKDVLDLMVENQLALVRLGTLCNTDGKDEEKKARMNRVNRRISIEVEEAIQGVKTLNPDKEEFINRVKNAYKTLENHIEELALCCLGRDALQITCRPEGM